ncbi:MAG: anthranilate phosphoribosyltransferase [Candidatus Nezhaarchaeota archaeon]|nr:anthranilate phosphoribosyltransferase [Candidatus Nezhaarchaeota archaeon]
MIREAIEKLVDKRSLTYNEAYESMREIMSGEATEAQVAAFLTALRMKGETAEEIIAFASAMRRFCRAIKPRVSGRLVDVCGTGGDNLKTFNVSTTAAFVVAGAGVAVAKHGNRSVTSKSGSADVLECLGLNLNAPFEVVERAIESIGVGFIYAPAFHPAMKRALAPRREIGVRTVFNILGPLTNPASADAQLVGVYDAALLERMIHAVKGLGIREAMVVHGLDGLDEISVTGKTAIAWLHDDSIKVFEVTPEELGVKRSKKEDLIGGSPRENAETTFKVLYGCMKPGDPRRDITTVNSAAGIIVGGKADDFACGLEMAQESIESGAAYRKLKELLKLYNNGNVERLEELERKYG